VIFTWGNVSAVDRQRGIIIIKPSGVEYDQLTPADMVLVDFEGKTVEGKLNPSSDTASHTEIYRSFDAVGGIVHTHSRWATIFAQARMPIPVMGTTHADYFFGEIPVTRQLNSEEVSDQYERNTGKVIVEAFRGRDPMETPAVLVAGHGPFAWGTDATNALHNAVVLESIAMMAYGTFALGSNALLERHLIDKHYKRKHGRDAYYGQ
jgi:L-ribulose-5-phosphate 4-epimerase